MSWLRNSFNHWSQTSGIHALKHGAKIRHYQIEEMRLWIIDGKMSRLTLVNPKNYEDSMSMYIKSEDLTKALEQYFDKIWERAEEVKNVV